MWLIFASYCTDRVENFNFASEPTEERFPPTSFLLGMDEKCIFYLRDCLRHQVHMTLVERAQGYRNSYKQGFTG